VVFLETRTLLFTIQRNSQHSQSTNVFKMVRISIKSHNQMQPETKFQLISRPLLRFATARQIKLAASYQDLGKQRFSLHSWRRRLCAWISQSVSFAFTLPRLLSSKASVIMITRRKWLLPVLAQLVIFDHNIWVITNHRLEREIDSMQTLNNPQRPKLQVYSRKMMILRITTLT
jgi:hypothetical protein